MGDWVAFWDSQHPLYVNARHRDVHYRTIAEDIAAYIPSSSAVVLDYGCGEALHGDRIAAAARKLILVEAAPNVRAGLAARFKDHPTIEVLSPQDVRALADRSVDLAVVNSVAQYLTSSELGALLVLFRRLLTSGGLLVIGDAVPPHASLLTDTWALLNFAAANGFLAAAIGGLLRTALSDYRQLRSRLGLSRYSEAEMIRRLDHAGFLAARAETNIGHNQTRMTFVARPR
jgi:SAM-dependent methyltransferase